jgi:tryptophanyl-tRNA synthetase
MKKEIVLTGLQPTGIITLGNYIGSIKQMIEYQNMYDSYIFVADMHAITVSQDKDELPKRIRSLIALYLASGIDPNKNTIFLQSENIYHANLSWVLECHSYFGELSRMHQFKEKSKKSENFTSGLLTYPVLMAADILLYDTKYVPVGIDQKQHVELTRDIAIRFNNKYGETFKIPEPIIKTTGTKIMDLQDPTKKMSKSDPNPKGYVALLDDINVIKNKIKSAVTDSEGTIRYDLENKPGVSNLLTILSVIKGRDIKTLEREYEGKNYQAFKEDVIEAVISEIKPIQDRYNELINSKELDQVLDEGRDYASFLARKKLTKVYNKVGLGRKR